MEWKNCNEFVRGDVISWYEPAFDGYDYKTRKVKGERKVIGKIVGDSYFDEQTGKEMFPIKVISSVGEDALAAGKMIKRTMGVLTYQGNTTRKVWDNEDDRMDVVRAKIQRDATPGV